MESREIEKAKAEFRATYREWVAFGDSYDCGLKLLVFMSSRAADLVRTMVSQCERLAELDPDCPKSVFKQIEVWRSALEEEPSEREVAIRELAGNLTL